MHPLGKEANAELGGNTVKLLRKWDYTTHSYISHLIPDDWNCLMYSEDMGEVVNCPYCGKALNYGNGYTSLQIHNGFGIGYIVCGECHINEVRRKLQHERQ